MVGRMLMLGRRDLLRAGAGTVLMPAVARAQQRTEADLAAPVCPAQGQRIVTNPLLPGAGENPFRDRAARERFWLPHPPRSRTALDEFFDAVYDDNVFEGGYRTVRWTPAGLVSSPEASAPADAAVPGASRHAKSLNWSGAFLHAAGGLALTHIVGRWTVPKFDLPRNHDGRTSRASIWIGLDGQGRHRDAALPQIGTVHTRAPSDPAFAHGAWFQWWDRRLDKEPLGLPHAITNLAVEEGDTIACSLEAFGPDPNCSGRKNEDRIRIFIANEKKKQFVMPFYVFAPAGSLAPDRIPRIAGMTAQWIIERPKSANPDQVAGDREIFAFPEYDSLVFRSCGTAAAPAPGDTAVAYRDLETARFISMYDRRQAHGRTVLLSGPAPDGWKDRSLRMRYGGTFNT